MNTETPEKTTETKAVHPASLLYEEAVAAHRANNNGRSIELLSACIMEHKDFQPAYITLVDLLIGLGFDHKKWDVKNAWSILKSAQKRFGDTPDIAERTQQLQVQTLQKEALDLCEARWPEFKNKHKGQRCVIVGNGPSLNKMDLSFLKNEIVFGLNRIYLGFERFDFEPDYLVCVNKFVCQQSAADFQKLPITKFISMEGMPEVKVDENTMIINPRHCKDFFSSDPREGLCIGSTVTYCAMQIAYYMGFETVVLIGVDHNFQTKGAAHKLVESQGDDPNHFDPDYFGKGYKWQLPDLDGSEQMYRIADAYFKAFRHQVLDATWGGHCDVFEKIDYRKFFLPEKYKKETAQ